jgi:O-antigen/teichoic acid export membrane protein
MPSEPIIADTPAPDVLDTPEAGGRIIRGSLLRTVGYVGGIAAGLISTPFMVRHLGEDDFGRYVTVNSLIFVVTGLTEGGLGAIAIREYAAGREGPARAELIRNLLGLRLALFVVGSIAALVFAVAAGYTPTMLAGTAISCVGLLFTALYAVTMVPMTARLQQGAMSALDFGRQMIFAVLSLALVVAGSSLLPFYVLTPIGTVVAAAIGLYLTRRDVSLRPSADVGQWKRLLRASLPYGAATAFSVLYFRVAVVLIAVVSTAQETGFYSLAFRVVELATGVPYLLVFVAFPLLARAASANDDERLRYALQKMFEVALILGTVAAVSIGLGAPFAVAVLGGPGFDDAITPLVVLGTAVVGTFMVSTWSYALLSLHHNRTLIIANGSAVVVGTALTLALCAPFGALGAAIATAATEIGLGIAYGIVLSRLRPDLRPDLTIVPKVAAAAALAVAVPVLLGLPSLPATLLGLALLTAVLLALRAVPAELYQALRRRPS